MSRQITDLFSKKEPHRDSIYKHFDFVCPYMRLLATSFLLHLQKVILIFCFVEKIQNILWFTLYSQKAKYTLNFFELDALNNTYLM